MKTLDDKQKASPGEDHLELKKLECEPIRALSTSQAVGPPTTSNTTTVGSPLPTTTTTLTSTKTIANCYYRAHHPPFGTSSLWGLRCEPIKPGGAARDPNLLTKPLLLCVLLLWPIIGKHSSKHIFRILFKLLHIWADMVSKRSKYWRAFSSLPVCLVSASV